MKPFFRLTILAASAVVAGEDPPSSAASSEAVPWSSAHLTDGDLVFRRGRDAVSRIALSYGDHPKFSHVGLIVLIGRTPFVIHSIPELSGGPGGVITEPLARFAASENAEAIAFYRLPAVGNLERAKLRRFALAAVGRPFDLDFKFSDDSAFYCTELVLKALVAAGIGAMRALPSIRVITVEEPVYPPESVRTIPSMRLLVLAGSPKR